MRYIRPFDIAAASVAGEWLIDPKEEAGCSVRLVRGGRPSGEAAMPDVDRFALVLAGEATLISDGSVSKARTGELILVPAGARGGVSGAKDDIWVEIEAALPEGDAALEANSARVISVDPSRFEGQGFAYQSLVDRSQGSQALRMNVLQVQPGAGSPDWHIHAFAQMYIITEGEMTIDIGRKRQVAGAHTLVFFPAGVVHRNFNASGAVERHVTLLVPEPGQGEVFDYAVTIHEHEAELLTELPL